MPRNRVSLSWRTCEQVCIGIYLRETHERSMDCLHISILKMAPHISLRDIEGETQSSFCSMSSSLHGLDGFLSSHCTVCSRGLSQKSSLAFLATNKAESHFLCSLAIWTLSFMKCFLFVANFKTVSIKLVIKVADKKVIHQS